MKKWIALVFGALCALSLAFAQGTDPAAVLKEIQELRATRSREAREAKKALDFNAVNAEVKAKAEAALKGVDLMMVADKDALSWAKLCAEAGRYQDGCMLAEKFIKTNPEPKVKYDAQIFMLSCCTELGEGAMIEQTLAAVTPVNGGDAVNLAMLTANMYVDEIKADKGAAAALKAIERIEKLVPYAELTTEQDKARGDSARSSLAIAKAELLVEMKRKDDAMKALDEAIGAMDPKSPLLRRVKSTMTQYAIVDSAAPAMPAERTIGEYAGLDAYKGKVVILDFFAHWCGPCIRSFPDLKNLYEANKDKGLVVVGVTSYYGFYKQENAQKRDMEKDTEFAKMGEFIKDHSMTWPVIYTDKANYDLYGVSGIPHVVLIDKKGAVHKIKVGYSPDSFAEFRKVVEALLKE
ncbi:MAG TPA: TlpA disulfide reductase family protein [Fimbriimonadaceae bacterium]|nr:TlpA disulfide reductase family protein [Fimbriimonadaceae bacterium]